MFTMKVRGMNFNAKDLGKKIADIRNREQFLQGEFAEIMGVSKNTLSYYERGINKPDAEFLYKLSNKFNISLDWLITGKTKLSDNDLNTQALSDVIEIVENALENTKVSPDKKAQLITVCYDYYISDEDEEKATKHIIQIVKLAS